MDLTDVTIPEKVSTEIEKEVERWNSEYRIVELMGRSMGTRYRVNLKIRIEPYIKAIDGVTDLRALEKRLLQKIPALQGVDIKGDVDSKRVEFHENRFKEHVRSTLKKYSNRYHTIDSLEFHFMPNQVEAHFNMIVDPGISVGEAHGITNLIEHEIIEEFDSAQVIIHIEPAGQ